MNASDQNPTHVAPTTPASRRVHSAWRALAILLLLVLLVIGAASASMYEQFSTQLQHLQAQLKQQARIGFLAVLLDQQQQAALLVTFDPNTTELQLQRLNEVKEGREDTMQLWALRDGQSPQSLGVLTPKLKTLQLPVQATALQGVTQLAISVEDKGGVPQQKGPRLPYLFTGAWVQKAL